jgi:hypothetical protein
MAKVAAEEVHVNGKDSVPCSIWKDWESHKSQTRYIEAKVTDMNAMLTQLIKHTNYLHKLDKLDSLDLLVKAVTNVNNNESKTTYLIARILGFVILGLVFVIAALLTGAHLGFLKLH